MSEIVATDFKTPGIDFEETSLDSSISQTSYGPSLIDGGRLIILLSPRDSVEGKPFECSYCFFEHRREDFVYPLCKETLKSFK